MTDSRPQPDRRILKTKTALRDAMLALMVSRGWDDLSIQEICDAANVGRSTFYVHYQSKDDLLSKSMNDLRDALMANAQRHDKVKDIELGPGLAFLTGLLQHMQQQRDVFRAAIGRRSGHGVARRFKEMVCQLVEADLQRHHHPAGQTPWAARFVAGGIVDAMAWWVDATTPPSILEMKYALDRIARAALAAALA